MTRISLAIIAAAITSSAATANAESYRHIDNLALRLQRRSAELFHEFRSHYRHTAQFSHLMADTRDIYYRAKHIHDVAHHRGSVYHLENDLRRLDRKFHHLEDVVRHIEHHPHGHIHGDTRHVRHLLAEIEDDIHHLRRDVERMARRWHDDHHGHHGHVRHRGSHDGPQIRFGNAGIYFNGSGFRFSF